MGGKSQLSKEIIKRIPPHKTFIEAFAGALNVILRKPPSPVEVVNDINENLINLWICIRDHLEEMTVYLDRQPISEFLFHEYSRRLGYTGLRSTQGIPQGSPRYTKEYHGGIPVIDDGYTNKSGQKGIPNVDRAAMYYYLIRCSFNGIVRKGLSFSKSPNRNITITRDDWYTISSRMKDVIILNSNYLETVKVYDSPESFFYLDPPYLITLKKNGYYEHQLTEKDHAELPGILSTIKGKFLLSMDNTEEAREMYREFKQEVVDVRYTDAGELFIMNYEPPEIPFYGSTIGIPRAPGGIPLRYPKGIPNLLDGYTKKSRAAFTTPNCPECGGRIVQKLYERHTLNGGKSRTFKDAEVLKCMGCGISFTASSGIPPRAEDGIPEQMKLIKEE